MRNHYMPEKLGEAKVKSTPSASSVSPRDESTVVSTIATSSPSHEYFEFRTAKAQAIFDYLTKAFMLDYMTKRIARADSGWRGLGDVAKDLGVSTSMVYAKKRNQLSPPLQELLQRGFVERRFFQRERGERRRSNET